MNNVRNGSSVQLVQGPVIYQVAYHIPGERVNGKNNFHVPVSFKSYKFIKQKPIFNQFTTFPIFFVSSLEYFNCTTNDLNIIALLHVY